MATPWGVSATGYVAKTQQQILSEEVSAAQGLIANNLDLSPVAPIGQVLAIGAAKEAEVWEVGRIGYNATSRGAAEGAQLDNCGSLIGCKRQPATYSTVYSSATFTAPGSYAAGTLVGFITGLSSQQASNQAAVVVPVTHPLGGAVSVGNPYVTGSSYAPATLFQAPLTGPNFGNALIAANAGNPGNVGAFAGIVSVSGWTAVVDLSVPTIGAAVETDTQYRVRQAGWALSQGSCTLPAIQFGVVNALQKAPSPVIATCRIAENLLPTTSAAGIPPFSYEVIVFDGINPNTGQNNPLIGQAIWNNKPAAGNPFGATSVVVLDSQGVQRVVAFTRPAQLPTYVVVNVQIASTATIAQVQQLVATAVLAASQGKPFTAYGLTAAPVAGAPTTLLPGIDVVPGAFSGVAQAQAGVVSVTSVLVGPSPNPTSAAIIRVPITSVAVVTAVQVNCTVFVP